MSISREELWNDFTAAGIVTGQMPQPIKSDSPWYVRVMLGFAGWLGALFLLLFFGFALSRLYRNSGSLLVVGAITCVLAALLLRISKNDFTDQFGLAVSFAGQGLFAYGLLVIFKHENMVLGLLTVSVIEGLLVYFVHNSVHRVLTAAAASIALCFTLTELGMFSLALPLLMAGFAFVWLNEPGWPHRSKGAAHTGYGLALAALYCTSVPMVQHLMWIGSGHRNTWLTSTGMYWLRLAALSGVILWVIITLLKREQARFAAPAVRCALIGAVIIAALSFKAPGILTGLIIIILGFANGNRVLCGFGIFSLLVYLSQYYYMMQQTLLTKSGILFATGAAMLGSLALLRLLCRVSKSKEG
jgi:hypothetical protein